MFLHLIYHLFHYYLKEVIEGAIVEVRAGTGGDEAGFFASELFEMVDILL